MIRGNGTDIIEIDRIEKAINTSKFIEKMFNNDEIQENIRVESIAGKFAAKEAVVKALGTGFSKGVIPKDIYIYNDVNGKPYVRLKGKAHEIAEKYGEYEIHLSISHNKSSAVAFAIWEVR